MEEQNQSKDVYRKSDVVVELEHVTKRYKLYASDRQAFLGIFFKWIKYKPMLASNDVSFKIHRGDSVAIIGRNGAGKSTLLKLITEVAFPTSGNITVRGRVSALLELTAGFEADFTGRENIYLKGHLMGIPDEEMKKMEQSIIDFAEIGDYIDQPTRTYSSGMKARLGFAISANVQPEILIIDEALSVGDVQFKERCLEKVKEIMSQEQVTLIFVTHSVMVAQEFCTRGILLEKGKMLYDGPIEETVARYEKLVQPKAKKKKRIFDPLDF